MTDRTAAAYGVLLVVCALWGSLGAAVALEAATIPAGTGLGAGFLVTLSAAGVALLVTAVGCFVGGVVAVRRVSSGSWATRPLSRVGGVGSTATLVLAFVAGPAVPLIATLLALLTIALVVVPALARPAG